MTKSEALKIFFDAILKGETATYNDYGYYVCTGSLQDCYRSYIKGSSRYNKRFKLLPNDLESYSIEFIMGCQALPKDSSTGQLFGVGRYAIIPTTLIGLVKANKTDVKQKFSPAVQDNFGLYLLLERKNLKNYITKAVADTKESLEAAALDLAKIWSSIGVPYDLTATHRGVSYPVAKNGSYYKERVGVKTEAAQAALKELRTNYNLPSDYVKTSTKGGLFFLAAIALGYYIYKKNKK